MKILGIEGMTSEQVRQEVQRGAKFVLFQYCISILILTFRRPSNIYFIPAGESSVGKGMPFTLLSLVVGWWGFPWGPIFTIGSLVTNLRGGKDVTNDIVAAVDEGEENAGQMTYNGPANWWAR